MGYIIDINDDVFVELRRESFRLGGPHFNEEFHYRNLYPLLAALVEAEKSERFQSWLTKEEAK